MDNRNLHNHMAHLPPQMVELLLKGAKGAYPKGTNVEKVLEENGDLNPIGTKGIVLGSLEVPEIAAKEMQQKSEFLSDKPLVKFMYYVLFDDTPTLLMDIKIKKAI